MKITAVLFFLIFSISALATPDPEMPGIVTDGLKAYQKGDGKAALAIWIKGSPMDKEGGGGKTLGRLLTQIEGEYGKMIGFEPVRVVTVSPSIRRVYVVLKFEKGPAFFAFDCFNAGETWIIPTLEAHTKMSTVFPSALISGP